MQHLDTCFEIIHKNFSQGINTKLFTGKILIDLFINAISHLDKNLVIGNLR